MNFSNKLELSLFVFLAFFLQKNCFAPAHTRSPKMVGRDKLDNFSKPDLEQPFKSEINPYPWIDYLQNPEKYIQLSLKEEEFQARGDIEYDEAEEKSQILSQSHNQIYEKLKLELEVLNLLLSDSGKDLADKYCLDKAALQKQEEINDFYKHNTQFCEQYPDKFKQHKQNLIGNYLSLIKSQLMANLKSKRDNLKDELFKLSCQEFGLTTLT